MNAIGINIVNLRPLTAAAIVFAALNVGCAAADPSATLAVKTRQGHFTSGSMVPLQVSFLNRGKVPFCFVQMYPAYSTFLFDATMVAAEVRVPLTILGRKWSGRHPFLPTHWLPPVQVVLPGGKARYRTNPYGGRYVCAGRFLDMTMPGIYRLRLVTKYGTVKDPPGTVHSAKGYAKIGAHQFLLQDGFAFRAVQSGGPLHGNLVTFSVMAPYKKLPSTALVKSHSHRLSFSYRKPASGILLWLGHVPPSPGPRRVEAYLCNIDKGTQSVGFAGDPFADFRGTQVAGPDGLNGDHLVEMPKPHYEPIPNWKKVPLTAYGKWLAKHPVKGLKWKTYNLKPGVVYKYAVPINLSCMYDMSLPGVYHVRVELANPHIWSSWMDVTVPQN